MIAITSEKGWEGGGDGSTYVSLLTSEVSSQRHEKRGRLGGPQQVVDKGNIRATFTVAYVMLPK